MKYNQFEARYVTREFEIRWKLNRKFKFNTAGNVEVNYMAKYLPLFGITSPCPANEYYIASNKAVDVYFYDN